MNGRPRVSVLDQSSIPAGGSPAAAIRESIEFARLCERLGYARFWVSEHHGHPGIAGSAPEVLLGALAVATRAIRIGSAGVLLPHYAPLKVAEQFRVLSALAPGRIDLGIGRGPGADRQTVYALTRGALDDPLAMLGPFAMAGDDRFANDVADVVALVSGGGLPAGHPFSGILAQPGPDPAAGGTALDSGPEPWIVGSSPATARVAARLGLPYCFAHFFADGAGAAEAIAVYRDGFRPGPSGRGPHVGVCVWAVAAPSDAEAEPLFEAYAHWRLARDSGRAIPFPDAAAIAAAPPTAAGRARLEKFAESGVRGSGATVAARLGEIAAATEADELVIVTTTHDPADRRRSCAIIAAALGLAPAIAPADGPGHRDTGARRGRDGAPSMRNLAG